MKMYELKEYLDGFMQFQHWRDAEVVVEIPEGNSALQVRAMLVFQRPSEPPEPGATEEACRIVIKRDVKAPLPDEPLSHE